MEQFVSLTLPPASLIEKVSIPFAPENVKFVSFKVRQYWWRYDVLFCCFCLISLSTRSNLVCSFLHEQCQVCVLDVFNVYWVGYIVCRLWSAHQARVNTRSRAGNSAHLWYRDPRRDHTQTIFTWKILRRNIMFGRSLSLWLGCSRCHKS